MVPTIDRSIIINVMTSEFRLYDSGDVFTTCTTVSVTFVRGSTGFTLTGTVNGVHFYLPPVIS